MRWAVATLLCSLLAAGPIHCGDEQQVPMPADIPPHHKGVIVGERHYDISNAPESIQHFGDHFISYGHHNYDMSQDPSVVHDYPYYKRRYRGMGLGDRERCEIMRKDFSRIDDRPTKPWVYHGAWKRGLHYRKPWELAEEDEARDRVDFPRPSWAVIYAKRRH